MKLPHEVNILGTPYTITYCEKAGDVDHDGYDSHWGQIHHWRRSIRVYSGLNTVEDQFQTLLHEMIHGIVEHLHIKSLTGAEHEDDVDLLALALMDTLTRNGWIDLEEAAGE